jgi:CRISPR-associated protein Cas5t
MPIVLIEAIAPVASWRPPEALTYHRTLPLPPYTTQVGLLGAALGLGLAESYSFVDDHALRLGAGGWHLGKARDLWKHQKLQGESHVSDILLREQWIDSRLVFIIEASDPASAERIARAYREPVYPLTAGTSDALMQPLAVRVEEAVPLPTRRLVHTLVYSEISPLYRPFEQIKDLPLTRTVQAPSVENLPSGFLFDTAGGRQLAGRELVSFIADAIELNEGVPPVVGYRVVPRSRPLQTEFIRWKEQGLEWTIPVHRYDLTPTPAVVSSTPPSPSGRRTVGRRRATGNT